MISKRLNIIGICQKNRRIGGFLFYLYRMTHQEFLKLISRSSTKQLVAGIFILLSGFVLTSVVNRLDDETATAAKICIYALAILCIVTGFLLFRKSIKTTSAIKEGRNALVNAINNRDGSYVLWHYEHKRITNKAEATAVHQIRIYCKNNKLITIPVKKSQVQELTNYLMQHFPAARVGYTNENKALYKQQVENL